MLPGDPLGDAEHLASIIASQQAIVAARLDPETLLALVVERTRALTEADGAAIDLLDGDELVHMASCGSIPAQGGLRLRVDASLAGASLRTGEVLWCDDTEDDPRVDRDACRRYGARSLIVAPLTHGAGLTGVLKVASRRPFAFDERAVATLRLLAGFLAASLEHAAAFRAHGELLAERTSALAALYESEQRFRGAFDNSAVGLALADLEGRLFHVNRALCSLVGRPEPALIGATLRDLIHPEDLDDTLAHDSRTRAGDLDGFEREGRFRHGQGHDLWAHLGASLVRDPGGRPGQVVYQVRDLTDRMHAEAERAERVRAQAARAEAEAAERRHRALAEAIPQVVWTAGPAGEAEFYNARWAEFVGADFAEGRAPDPVRGWLPLLHPEDVAPALGRWQAALDGARPLDFECRLLRASDGSHRWHLVRAVPVLGPEGAVVQWVGTCTDVDDRRRVAAELLAARDDAEAAGHVKDRFLAVLSHELRTPLTPVLATVTAMLDEPGTGPEIRPTLELIRRGVELEARLIDDLLDVTHIVRGRLHVERSPIDLHALIHQTLGLCRSDLYGKRLRLELDLRATSHHLSGDAPRLQQVLWNLVRNAVKFTPEGGKVTLRTRNAPEPEGVGPPRVIVEVSDTGVGIEAEALPRIFHAFEQGEGSIVRQYGGLGLGLAIGRFIAEAHEGGLTAASPGRNQGSTFTLELQAAPAPDHPPSGSSAASPPPPGRALRILLVEDDPPSLRVLARLLQQRGHEITTAVTVASALEIGSSPAFDFDLLLSDIGLPDGTGLDLIRQLRALRPVRGIALSGFGLDSDLAKSRSAGFLAHLTKPVNFASLEATIRQVATAEASASG